MATERYAPQFGALIPGYKPYVYQMAQDNGGFTPEHWEKECVVHGGFNPYTKTFTPFTSASRMMFCDYLDAITAAVEAGIVRSSPGFVSQLFESVDVFEEFLRELDAFYTHRMVDRWYDALRHLIGRQDESGFVTCEEIANAIRHEVAISV